MTVYGWKRDLRGSAQAVGDHLQAMEGRHDGLTAEDVVADAKRKRSLLHAYFEWDDTAAAAEYRLEQARHLMRNVSIVIEGREDKEPVRAFVRLASNTHYRSLSIVLGDDEMRDDFLAQAMRELRSWQRRYADYAELAEVFAAIGVTEKEMAVA